MSTSSTPELHAVICRDHPSSHSVRASTRPVHLEWAERSGAVLFGGPLLEKVTDECGVTGQDKPCGSFFIMKGDDTRVRRLLESDPYKLAGLFEHVEVRRWIRGMVNAGEDSGGAWSEGNGNARHLFCIWCVDKEGMRDLRKLTRPLHLEWWKTSGRRGVIGPFPAADGDSAVGTLIVCEGDTIEEVKDWSRTDPYALSGLFDHVDVFPIRRTMGSIYE